MRYYIGNKALRTTLDDLVKKDQETMRVFREVMLYRCPATKHSKKHAEVIKGVKEMLMMPRIVIMSVINIILTAICLMILPKAQLYLPHPMVDGVFVLAMLHLFVFFEFMRIVMTLRSTDKCYLYIMIDELIARKVIQMVPRTKAQPAVHTHKNRKANVAK